MGSTSGNGMNTPLYLIRHGETEGADIRRYKGSIDVPLSEKGEHQIEKVSAFILQDMQRRSAPPFPPELLKAVYCSDLQRASKSAEIIARPFSLDPAIVPALRERNFGIWEGMSFDEIKKRYSEEFDAWAENPLQFSPIQGESTVVMAKRVIGAFEKIIGHHRRDSIAIVSHGGVNRIIICHILGISFENIFRVEQDYAALNIIEFRDRYPVIKLMNGIVDV
jgi:alpha-ribazole phosphatase